jgi:hypothetical protein
MIGAFLASGAAITPVTYHPVYFRCDVVMTTPTPRTEDNIGAMAVGRDWVFDDRFVALTGIRNIVAESQGEKGLLVLHGEAGDNHLTGMLSVEDEDLQSIALDWRVTNGEGENAPFVNSGVGKCQLVQPGAQTGPSGS